MEKGIFMKHITVALIGIAIAGHAFGQGAEPILEPGQSFSLRIAGIPNDEQASINQTYTISDAGTIKLLYLPEMKAAGLRPSQLARNIESGYRSGQIYTKPNIVISLLEAGTVQRFVSVMGEVNARQTVGYTPGLTILDAVARCGGFSDFADPKKVKLTRKGKVSYHDLSRTTSADNAILLPNDILTVPPRRALGGIFGGKRD